MDEADRATWATRYRRYTVGQLEALITEGDEYGELARAELEARLAKAMENWTPALRRMLLAPEEAERERGRQIAAGIIASKVMSQFRSIPAT